MLLILSWLEYMDIVILEPKHVLIGIYDHLIRLYYLYA